MRVFVLVPHEDVRGPIPGIATELVMALRACSCYVETHRWGQRHASESLLTKARDRARDVVGVWRALRVREFDVTVINTSHDWWTLVRDLALVPALRRGGRVVLQLHGSNSSKLVGPGNHAFKLATKALLRAVDGVLVLSSEEQCQWQAFDSRALVFAVKNPYVPINDTQASEAALPHSTQPRVLFVGRLIEAKGIYDVIDAFAQVVSEVTSKLVIVGTGGKEREVRERVARLGISSSVAIKGFLSPPDLHAEYERAAVFVLPTVWPEGFPTVLSEAMGAGLPIVTTRIRGAADHLIAGEHALFVEPHDVGGIASAMLALLKDPELADRIGRANRLRVRIFAPQVVAREYLEILEGLIPTARAFPREGPR